jgi:hypothetical protein
MTTRATLPDPAVMSWRQINTELDKLDRETSRITDELLAAGRGDEKPSETLRKTDPLSSRFQNTADRQARLRTEIETRYGPNAPHRLPSGRGYGARVKLPSAAPRPRGVL